MSRHELARFAVAVGAGLLLCFAAMAAGVVTL